MRQRTRPHLSAGLVLAFLLGFGLTACGNDDAPATGEPAPNGPTATPAEDTATATATRERDDRGHENTATPATDDAADQGQASETPDAAQREPLSIAYEVEAQGELVRITLDSDPPRYAMYMQGDFGLGPGTFVTIFDGENSYWCTDDGQEELCLELESDAANPFIDDRVFMADRDDTLRDLGGEDADVTPTEGRSIAGEQADCFDITGPEAEGIVCMGNETDIPLLVEGTFDGESLRMEVTGIEDVPGDAAFEPPYPVIDTGG